MPALSIATPIQPQADFRAYLEQSLRNPFVLDLKDCSLMEVIRICAKAKSKIHPNYKETTRNLSVRSSTTSTNWRRLTG